MLWKNEVAVVTGASGGIGLAVARLIAERGAAVALCSRSADKIHRAAAALTTEGHRAFGMACDVRKEQQVADFAAAVRRELGAATLLVNNAGIGKFGAIQDLAVAAWDAVIETNLRGMFLVTRAFLPPMLAAGRGAIVNVASLAGHNGFAGGVAYCAAKHGVLGFSKALLFDVRQRGVRVIAVCPGSTDTPFFDKDSPFTPNRERILAARDVAEVIVATLELDERATVSELDIRPTNP